jgi:hypothetical protein
MPAADAGDTELAQCALRMTRAALERWSGKARPHAALARDLPRVSPQARWLAQAQYGLAEWLARGGFSQTDDGAMLATPQMYQLPTLHPAQPKRGVDACID